MAMERCVTFSAFVCERMPYFIIDGRFAIGVMKWNSLTSSRLIAAAISAHFGRECSIGGDLAVYL